MLPLVLCVHRAHLCHCTPNPPTPAPPSPPGPRLFIQQRDLAVVAVVAAHLAVGRVQVGGVGEGWREGVIVRGGVARRGEQRLWIRLGRRWRGVVVLVLACGGAAAVAQGLSLSQLVAEGRHPLFFLQTQQEESHKSGPHDQHFD